MGEKGTHQGVDAGVHVGSLPRHHDLLATVLEQYVLPTLVHGELHLTGSVGLGNLLAHG